MRPAYTLTADGQDVTRRIEPRLMRLRIEDGAGLTADTLELVVDDADHAVALPRTGAELEVAIGYRETGLTPMGLWVVSETSLSGPPATITVRAHAANFGNSDTVRALRARLRESRTQSWHGLTLGDIVGTIAARAGYEARVDPSLAAVTVRHVDQTDESDLHFITRLARLYGAVAKPVGARLVFVPRGVAKTTDGRALDTVTLRPADVITWRVRLAERARWRSVVAHWTDVASGDRIPVRAGEGDPTLVLRGDHPDEATARAAAQARLDTLGRSASTLRLTLPGNPMIAAGTPLVLDGFRDGVDGRWTATRVTHTLDSRGYATQVEGEAASA